jgi:hypothetical protein
MSVSSVKLGYHATERVRLGAFRGGNQTMKIKTLSFLALLLAVALPALTAGTSAAGEGGLHKKISVEYRKAALGEVFKDIEKKTGVSIACAEKGFKDATPVSCAIKDTAAGRILNRILRRQGLKLESADGDRVTVVKHAWGTPLAKKEEVYGFAKKPTLEKLRKDTYAIEFETRGFCDCTVAVEDAGGRIHRHLASGVLGANAPEPFRWNSRQQRVIWDGKDDRGRYVARTPAEYANFSVRVSLGLKARMERTLFWSPHKRAAPSQALRHG